MGDGSAPRIWDSGMGKGRHARDAVRIEMWWNAEERPDMEKLGMRENLKEGTFKGRACRCAERSGKKVLGGRTGRNLGLFMATRQGGERPLRKG